MKRSDLLSSLFLLGLAILICLGALRLEVGNPHQPAPGFFPFVSGLALGIFSWLILLRAWKKVEPQKRFWRPDADKKGILLALGVLIFYALSLERLGFLLTNLLFFFLIGRFVAHRNWGVAVAYSILGSTGVQLIFGTLFNTPLPSGLFPSLVF